MGEIFHMGHALIVGVGADLPNTVDDAKGIADILSDPERCSYQDSQVNLLTSEDATRENILKTLDYLAQVSDHNSTVIVYFSGHGYQLSSQGGQLYYLMPYGYNITKLPTTAISGEEFSQKLKAIKSKKLVVLLDCCHAGGVGESKIPSIEYSKSSLPPETLELLEKGSGRILIASSREDEFSYAGKPYSAFTLALIEAFCGFGVAKKDGYVRVADLALHTREVVPYRTNDNQHPVLHFEQADNFVLAYYASGNIEPKGLPFDIEPEIEPEPGVWTIINQRFNTIRGTTHVGDSEIDNAFYQPGWNIQGNVINVNIQDRSLEIGEEKVSALVDRALANHIGRLASYLTLGTEERLEEIRNSWREGRKGEVYKWLSEQKSNVEKWEDLSPTVKAKILRFEASLELDQTQDIVKTKQIADQAHDLSPEDDDTILRALIAYREKGPERAVELLESKDDIDSINLSAAFLLELGNPDECLRMLSDNLVNNVLEPDAETHRLRALANVLQNNLIIAQLEILKAIYLAPKWESIRFTKALIDYLSVISPAALHNQFIQWPLPIPQELVKTDDNSIERLQISARTFRELARMPDKSVGERQSLYVWYMACLMNDPDSKEEAIKICEAILRENPTDIRAIAWTTSRRLDIDLEPSKNELKKLHKDGLAEIAHILTLVNIYQSNRKIKSAINLLDQTLNEFKEFGAEAIWYFWYTQLLTLQGNPEAALRRIEDSKFNSKLKPAITAALHKIAEKTGEWKPLIDHLEYSYQDTEDPEFLLILCQIMAHIENWEYVADRSEELINLVQTGEALRIAAYSMYNSGKLEKTIGLLNKHQILFQRSILPNDLSNLRVICKQKLGIISEAISEAEKNVIENPNIENFLTLIDICFTKGDHYRLVLHARKLVNNHDLPNQIYLRLSRMIYLEDHAFAVSLWKKSITELPDSSVGQAIELGFRLGLDNETRPLMIRMHELGLRGEGGIQIFNIEDFKGLIAKQQENIVYLDEIYRNGTVPIHIVAEQLNRSLSSFYHSLLEVNEKSPDQLRQFSLLSRHGGRILISGIPENVPTWRLNLDITAILLAEHFGILNKVENAFKPIRIPSLIIPALTQMREKATFHQPSRLDDIRIVNQLIENEKIKFIDTTTLPPDLDKQFFKELGSDWLAIYKQAQANEGYVVDFLPKKMVDEEISPTLLPEGFEEILVNCRDVIDALRQHGPISQKTYETVIQELGTEGIKIKDIETLRIGYSLYCYANTIEVLASTGILDDICDTFEVHIDRNMYHALISDLKAYELRAEEVEWLGQLITKINYGIDRGVYEIIPFSFDPDKEKYVSNNPSLGCIITLLKFEYQEKDAIWVDDRFTNGYSRREAIPIIGINEVLKTLVSAGELSNDDYFAILNRIRESNLRFIPIQSDELLYQIRQAILDDGRLIETREIINLKHYIAASLFHGKFIQRPPMQEDSSNQLGEVEFLLNLDREILGAIIELWISEEDENTCLVKANWLLSNLYFDHLGMFEAINWHRPNQNDLFLLAVSLSSFLVQAITFPTKEKGEFQNRRQKYLDWIYHRHLKTKFEANPTLLPTVVEIIKDSVLRRESNIFQDVPEPVLLTFLQKYFSDFPEDIKNEFESDTEFMQSLGFTSLIKLGDFNFELKDFLNAMSLVVDGKTAIVNPLDLEEEVQIKRIDTGGEFAVLVTNLSDETDVTLQDDIFALLSNSPSIREETLLRHRLWFDFDDQTFKRIVSEIVSKENPQERIDLADKWRNSSATTFYKNLYEQLNRREPFSLEIFRPLDAKALLRHHRLNLDIEGGKALQEALDLSAKDLISEFGIFEAISRFSGLPISFPKSLLEVVKGLPFDEKRILVKRCLNSMGSPLSKLHFIRLLVHISFEDQTYYRLARWIIRNIIQSDDSEFDAYFSILNWTNNDFNLWPDTRDKPAHIRLLLVWAHAHRIYTIFKSLEAHDDWLKSTFEPLYQPISSDLFERDRSLFYDVSNPKQANHPRLVLSGLQYCLGEKANNYITGNTKELLHKVAFTEIGGITGPDLTLIRDFSQATNILDSFIGESFVDLLTLIFEEDVSHLFSQENLRLLVKHAIDKLVEVNNDFYSWSQLHAVLDGLPPYEDIVDQEILLFSGVKFAQLIEENIMLGILAIQTASLQEPYLDDADLHNKLQDEIIKVTSAISNIDLDEETKHQGNSNEESIKQNIHGLLLDSALNLSIISTQPVDDFELMITRMIDVNPTMIPYVDYLVKRLYDELPINQSKKLNSLLLRLRAEI